MKRKFKEGELIVLKRKCYIDEIGFPSTVPPDEILKRTHVKFRADSDSFLGDHHRVPKGTVAVVRGYENVFMLQYDVVSEKPNDGTEFIDKRGFYTVNDPDAECLIVLLDEHIVAFEDPDYFFETLEQNRSRHANVEVSIRVTLKMKNVKDSTLRKRVDELMEKSDKFMSASDPIIKIMSSDGTIIETRMGDECLRKERSKEHNNDPSA